MRVDWKELWFLFYIGEVGSNNQIYVEVRPASVGGKYWGNIVRNISVNDVWP